MELREYNPETDFEKCKELCDRHGVAFRTNDFTVVSVNSTGDITGVGNVMASFVIEPLVTDNPITTVKMLDYLVSFFTTRPLFGFVNKENKKFTDLCSKKYSVKLHKNIDILEL